MSPSAGVPTIQPTCDVALTSDRATSTPTANEGVETDCFPRTLREHSTERRKGRGIALNEVVGEGVWA